jgi:hypothetical protein
LPVIIDEAALVAAAAAASLDAARAAVRALLAGEAAKAAGEGKAASARTSLIREMVNGSVITASFDFDIVDKTGAVVEYVQGACLLDYDASKASKQRNWASAFKVAALRHLGFVGDAKSGPGKAAWVAVSESRDIAVAALRAGVTVKAGDALGFEGGAGEAAEKFHKAGSYRAAKAAAGIGKAGTPVDKSKAGAAKPEGKPEVVELTLFMLTREACAAMREVIKGHEAVDGPTLSNLRELSRLLGVYLKTEPAD